MQAKAAISRAPDWRAALDEVLEATRVDGDTDLALLFASSHYAPHYEELVPRARAESGARRLAGCSGQGIIGPEREVEGQPALSLLRLVLPDCRVEVTHVTQDALEGSAELGRLGGVPLEDVNAWLVFADPFRMDIERLLGALAEAYPGVTLIGGLASARMDQHGTHVFVDDEARAEGAVAVALGGNVVVRTVVSQGATPIGEPWTITSARGNVLETIGGRPAYQVLVETVQKLPAEVQQRAARNLLVGLAIDEYKDEFRRGDYLIRNLTGVDRESGAVGIGAYPRVGQTLQFQMRDATAADEDLRELLAATHQTLGDARPVAAVLCSCNGRGAGLFGASDHDARGVAAEFGAVPLAGFFCNGEIGPIGGKTFLHGFTASIALLMPREEEPAP